MQIRSWEYKRTVVDGRALIQADADHEMCRLGEEGWELAGTVSREKHGYQHEVCFLWKRPASP